MSRRVGSNWQLAAGRFSMGEGTFFLNKVWNKSYKLFAFKPAANS